jgi:hypothetical protein
MEAAITIHYNRDRASIVICQMALMREIRKERKEIIQSYNKRSSPRTKEKKENYNCQDKPGSSLDMSSLSGDILDTHFLAFSTPSTKRKQGEFST